MLSEYLANAPAGFVIRRRRPKGVQIRREPPDMFGVHTRATQI
jgi:hypothetical protein